MGKIIGYQCVRCNKTYGLDIKDKVFNGCPSCKEAGAPANLSTVYDYQGLQAKELQQAFARRPRNMWRYLELLPVASIEEAITLQEGCTPMVRLSSLEKKYGIGQLYVKQEYRNPTGSYKDRLASSAITRAKSFGAKVITVSSTGNHGASTAAYASKAGKDCIIFTLASMPVTMKVLMQTYGAKLVQCEKAEDRWDLMSWGVKEKHWYPTGNFSNPPIGSNPYGVDGYKTIACEICEDLGWQSPSMLIQPTAYGDGIYGIWKGFSELKQLGLIENTPRMFAAEIFGSLKQALKSPDKVIRPVPTNSSIAFSIATPMGTYQSLRALLESNGEAIAIAEDQDLLEVQIQLGKEGIYAETSSCVSVAAAVRLAQEGRIGQNDTIVCILTSTGQRDPWSTQKILPKVPSVGSDPRDLIKAIREVYGKDI